VKDWTPRVVAAAALSVGGLVELLATTLVRAAGHAEHEGEQKELMEKSGK
jgi:hypothetical protein